MNEEAQERLEKLLLEGLESGEPTNVTAEYIQQKRAALAVPPVKSPSALGKYAFVGGGSDAFTREKQAEIEREDKSKL